MTPEQLAAGAYVLFVGGIVLLGMCALAWWFERVGIR